MSLRSRTIPNLFNGISQQPPSLRLPSQGESQENSWTTVAEGISKRPPTQYVAKLNALTDPLAQVHVTDRDAVEKYVMIVSGGALYVYDLLTGVAKTVNVAAGTSLSYLSCATPRDEIVMVSIADVTFICNKTTVTAMDATLSPGTVTAGYQSFEAVSAISPAPANGTIYHIVGTPANAFDDYYVKRITGAYEECVLPGMTYKFDPGTMPHKLTRESNGTFTFSRITWTEQLVGDSDSAPLPSFIGNKITDMFFHRNRFGLTSGEGVSLSRADSYFNFFRQTITAIIDSDPIDGQVSTGVVSLIHHAISFNSALLLFSDKMQFQLSSGTVLTPKTAKIDPTTSFNSSESSRPVGSGQDLFFAVDNGAWTGVREYFVEKDTVSNDAADITAHCPKYVPAPVTKMATGTNVDALFLLSPTAPNKVFVYKYYWGSTEKIQSSWGHFAFDSGDYVLSVEMMDQRLYMVTKRSDGMHLEYINFQPGLTDTGLSFYALLDRKVSLTGSYSAGTNLTTWTLPYAYTGTMQVVPLGSFIGQAGSSLQTVTRPSSTTVAAIGNYSTGVCVLGIPYTSTYQFSEQFLKDRENISITAGRLQLRYMTLSFASSGYFEVHVTASNRDTYIYPYTGKNLGTASLTIGTASLSSGEFQFPVKSQSSEVTIKVVNPSHLPCTHQSAEWEGFYATRSARA